MSTAHAAPATASRANTRATARSKSAAPAPAGFRRRFQAGADSEESNSERSRSGQSATGARLSMRERFAASEAYRLGHRRAQAASAPFAAMTAASVAHAAQAAEVAANAAEQLGSQGQRLLQEQGARETAEAVARDLVGSLQKAGERQRVSDKLGTLAPVRKSDFPLGAKPRA